MHLFIVVVGIFAVVRSGELGSEVGLPVSHLWGARYIAFRPVPLNLPRRYIGGLVVCFLVGTEN